MKKIALCVVVLLASCAKVESSSNITAPPQSTTPDPKITQISEDLPNGIYRMCDNGRQLYMFSSSTGSTIAVADNAAECAGR